jgi:DNA (cytosine-5)-methyltransferase 1
MAALRTTRNGKNSGSRLLSVASLFAGAGGLDIAACQTGLVGRLFSTDVDPVFLETTRCNIPRHFPEVEHFTKCCDARALRAPEVLNTLGHGPELAIAGPPCDDFTSIGKRRGLKGEKGPLIWEFARLVEELSPAAFVFENVPNLASLFRKGFDAFRDRLERIGYSITCGILNASSYGAPTHRERLFMVGFKAKLIASPFRFPGPSHGAADLQGCLFSEPAKKPFVNVADVIQDLPDVGTPEASRILNHTPRVHRPETIAHMRTVPQGNQVFKSYRYRAPWIGLCWSLTAGCNSTKAHIHPIYDREMSVREYARIQGFPDTWEFCGTRNNGLKQVANSVPIPLGSAVLDAVCQLCSSLA